MDWFMERIQAGAPFAGILGMNGRVCGLGKMDWLTECVDVRIT